MSSRISVLLFVVLIGPLLACQTQTTQTAKGCTQGQTPMQYTVTVSEDPANPAIPKVDKDTVELCKVAGDSVVWQGQPRGLKFGITFDPADKPFKGAYFTESENTSNEITATPDPNHKFKYRVYFPKSGGVLDPGIIIK